MKNEMTASGPAEQALFEAIDELLEAECTDKMREAFRGLDRQARIRGLRSLPSKLNIGLRGWAAVALIIVCIGGMALPIVASIIHSPKTPGKAELAGELRREFPVSWKDQAYVPQPLSGDLEHESGAETAAAFEKTYRANPSGQYKGPVTTVARDVTVIVIAKPDRRPGVPRVLVDDHGDLTTSCTLQAGGTLRRIGSESGRQLVVYVPPTNHAAIGEKWCVSGDMFYVR